MQLAGKVAVVVGGSNGIGAATVRALAAEDAQVVATYHQGRERAEQLVASLPGPGHRALHVAMQDSDSIRQAAADVRAQYGHADILVVSAGTTRPIPHDDLEALDDDLLDTILTVNVRGPFSTIRAFAPLLRESGDGVIVNVSSISAFTGSGSNIGYCASKAALDTMTMSLARVLGPQIRVLAVSPAAVATDFVAGRDRKALEAIAQRTPLRRVTEPEDVARAIMACVTHLTMSTGVTVVVDGGRALV